MNNKLITFFGMFVGLSLQLSSSLAIAIPLNTENKTPKQLVFIDSSIKNYQNLITDVQTNSTSNDTLIVTLGTRSNPVLKISQILQNYKNLDAIHFITHGFSGGLKLGNTRLEQSTVDTQQIQFTKWGKSLSTQGDILLYGCDVAKGQKGSEFIQALSNATHADVIASNNTTGNPSKNQDWLLEKATGTIETASIIPNSLNNRFKTSLDIFESNAFLYGHNINVGIGPDGAFGSTVDSPNGPFANKPIGYLSDPSKNGFTNGHHGDFFMAGIQEEGWGITLNGVNYNNNRNSQTTGIQGSLSDYKSATNTKKVTWKGKIHDLDITQDYRIYNTGLAIIVDVSLTNTGTTEMTDVYYMRTVDPDNNAEQNLGDSNRYITTNTIRRQGGESGGAAVTATQADGSILGLCGHGNNSRVAHGGPIEGRTEIFYRNPAEIYEGAAPLKTTGSATEDQPLGIAFKFDTIYPGQTVKFRVGYQLADIQPATIDIDANNSSGATGNSYTQIYKLGTVATKIADTDISFTDLSTQTLTGATIKITNAHPDDKLTVIGGLPSGITFDSNETNNNTEINLTGEVSNNTYNTLLQNITFENPTITSHNETRIVSISVLDNNFTASTSAESFIEIITPITLAGGVISGDGVVNANEANTLVTSGAAAPETDIQVILTDKNGKKVVKNIKADNNGLWTLTTNPADISTLADGIITVEIVSSDPNGNTSSLTPVPEILKDTVVSLDNITPADGDTAASSTPTLTGKSDPNADITITLPNGDKLTTKADNDGNWSYTLAELPLGSTATISIETTDTAGNTTRDTITITIPTLPLEVVDIETDGDNFASSTTPTFSGTGKVGASITIEIPTDTNTTETCSTTVDTDGNWSCHFSILPSGGPYQATIIEEDVLGNTASATKTINIPDLPLVMSSPLNNAVITGTTPVISGTSTPNTTVTVIASTGQTCTAITDDTNHWSCKLPTLPLDKSFTLTITTTDSAGNTTTKTVDISTDKLPLSILSPGDKGTAGDSTPSFIGTSTSGTEITVTASTGAECTTVADADGNWTCELPPIPVGGPYDITIKAEDSNGNITTITESISIPKIPLVITSPSEDEVFTGSSMSLTGTSDPNTDITVLGPDGEVCKTTSDSTGKWSCEIHNLRDGTSKHFTVISGNKADGQKITILTLDVSNSSEKVNTILSGGGGNLSFFMIVLLALGLLTRKALLKK